MKIYADKQRYLHDYIIFITNTTLSYKYNVKLQIQR
jgi:hypothetical protein